MPKPETGPEIDVKSVLEKGEIIERRRLRGHTVIDVVEIKDDGKGLFRPEEPEIRERPLRIQLELLAKFIDDALGFGLVPEIVKREVELKKGTLQRYLT